MITEGADQHQVVVRRGECCNCGEKKGYPWNNGCKCGDPGCCECTGCCSDADCPNCPNLKRQRSRGIDPDFYHRTPAVWDYDNTPADAMARQFPDRWCHALTPQDLLEMYVCLYGPTLGLLPTTGMRLADELTFKMMARGGLDMHDAGRLVPLVKQVKKIADSILKG